MHLVMEMRPRREAAHPDIADDFTLAYRLAFVHPAGKRAEVAVSGRVLLMMLDLDVVAIAGNPAGAGHDAVARGIHRGPDRSAEIDAAMHPAIAEDRVMSHAKSGGDASAVDRSAQQRLSDVFADGAIITELAITRLKAIEAQP